MNDVINYYLQWKDPEGYVKCTECGVWTKINSKKSIPKYCDTCAKYIKNEQNKSYNRKIEKVEQTQ